MQQCTFIEKSPISGILTKILLQYVETSPDINFQNASAFLLAFSRMGKTQQCKLYCTT